MNWHDVWIVFGREMRTAFRERTVIVNGLLMPVFLYPLMLWAAFTALVFVQGLTEGYTSRVVLLNVPEAHRALVDTLRAREDVDLREAGVADALWMLDDGELDAVVERAEKAGHPIRRLATGASGLQIAIAKDPSGNAVEILSRPGDYAVGGSKLIVDDRAEAEAFAEMMRAAELNTFDLAMWMSRPHDG